MAANLYGAGWPPNKEVARRLRMGERTVRYWCARGIPYGKPGRRTERRRAGDPATVRITERGPQGCRNWREMWREMQAQGLRGSTRTVYRVLASLRGSPLAQRGKAEQAQTVPEAPFQDFSASEAVWLFVRAPTDLDDREQAPLTAICQAGPTAQKVYELTRTHPEHASSTRG
jgi:hypothetical protein